MAEYSGIYLGILKNCSPAAKKAFAGSLRLFVKVYCTLFKVFISISSLSLFLFNFFLDYGDIVLVAVPAGSFFGTARGYISAYGGFSLI